MSIVYRCDNCDREYEDAESLHEDEGLCVECGCACADCGDIVCVDDMHDTVDGQICDDCLVVCESCGEKIAVGSNNTNEYSLGRRKYYYCDGCWSEMFTCASCGDLISYDNEYYCEECDQSYCGSCFDDEGHGRHTECAYDIDYVYNSDYEPDEFMYKAKDNDGFNPRELYLGVEWEIDGQDEAIGLVEDLIPYSDSEQLFYFKTDGSLSDYGVELVTHPLTIDVHRDEFPWHDMCNVVKQYTCESRVKRTCGLHIHSSADFFMPHVAGSRREAEKTLATYKLAYFFDRHWDILCALSRRTGYSYCNRPAMLDSRYIPASIYDAPAKDKPITKARKTRHHLSNGKYMAVQLAGRTFETRLWCGTANPDTILATLELTNSIMRYVKDTPQKKLEKSPWKDVAKELLSYNNPKYLKKYMSEKGVI